MKARIFLLFIFLSLTILSFSQRRDTHTSNKTGTDNSIGKTSFFAEAGGPGIAFSANIDTRFAMSRLGWGIRGGVGFVSSYNDNYSPTIGFYGGDQQSAFTVPVQLNYIFGKSNSPHSFEVGAGGTYISKKLTIMDFYYYGAGHDRRTQFFGTFSFMYRRQPVNGGFSWRAGFTPLFAKGLIQPFGAVSLGYNF